MSSTKKPELEFVIGYRLSPEMLVEIHSVIEECVDKELEKVVRKLLAEKLEKLVKKCLEERLSEEEVLELRKIPHKEAVALIKEYIDEHQGCRTSNIIYNLQLDPDLVLKVLGELEEKKKIRGE